MTPEGTTLYISAFGVLTELTNPGTSGEKWTDYLSVGDTQVGMRVLQTASETLTTRYFHSDHLGSISVISDENGNVVERLSYDAWGKQRFPNGTDDPTGSITSQSTRGFTGEEELSVSGLVHLNGRVYDPILARMTSADPNIPHPMSTQSWNRYAYVNNRPLAEIDPEGYEDLPAIFVSPPSGSVFPGLGLGAPGPGSGSLGFPGLSCCVDTNFLPFSTLTLLGPSQTPLAPLPTPFLPPPQAPFFLPGSLAPLGPAVQAAPIPSTVSTLVPALTSGLNQLTNFVSQCLEQCGGISYVTGSNGLRHAVGGLLDLCGAACEPATQASIGDIPGAAVLGGLSAYGRVARAISGAKGIAPYAIGSYDTLKAGSVVGDGLDIHHVIQANPAGQIVPDYLRSKGPSIALPELEHDLIPRLSGSYSGTARDLLARDLRNLRNFTNAPNAVLQDLSNLNKQMYPDAFAK